LGNGAYVLVSGMADLGQFVVKFVISGRENDFSCWVVVTSRIFLVLQRHCELDFFLEDNEVLSHLDK
jgi:hypothetical protein